jgi:succinate-semialdehyde dehydrogenase/glutarate-semialdehyde dehydrogenase
MTQLGLEETPSSSVMIARALEDAGLPSDVLHVVLEQPAAIFQHLIASPIVRKISFIGSIVVGERMWLLV